jgi:hypothetical protein
MIQRHLTMIRLEGRLMQTWTRHGAVGDTTRGGISTKQVRWVAKRISRSDSRHALPDKLLSGTTQLPKRLS